MVRHFWRLRAVTRHERHVKRVLAKEVIQDLDGSLVILLFAREVVGMQQPNALIGGNRIGTPYKVILCHCNAKARFSAVHKLVGGTQNFLLGFASVATKLSLVRCLFVSGKAHDIAPVRDIFRRAGLLVRSVTRRDVEFRTGKNLFVVRIVVFVGARRDIRRISEIVAARVREAPSISLLGSFEALGSISGVERLINAGGHRHHGSKVKRTRRALADSIKLGIVRGRHHVARETERGKLVVDAAIRSLHGKHPVEIVLDFG